MGNRKEHNMNIAIIVGTRPEIIKMSPVIRECEKRKQIDSDSSFDYFILHTGHNTTATIWIKSFEDTLPDKVLSLPVSIV